ncbi:MAG: PQQ-binding-like beta-propeller repeat protein [Polyangiaceae bacterium]
MTLPTARPAIPAPTAPIARVTLLALTAVALSLGCGGGQTQGSAFDPSVRDDGTTMVELERRLSIDPIPPVADVAVGVFGDHSLVGVPLAAGEPWTFEHPVDCRPVLGGGVVVGSGNNEMFGLDARTGKLLWTRKAGGCLRGAGDDGQVTVVSARPVTGFGGIVVAIARDGLVVRQVEDDSNIGVPAIVDGVVFLPWEGRYVSAYDLSVGQEVARVRLADRVTRAFVTGGALFFGERRITRFDDRLTLAPKGKATTTALPVRPLPDDPRWLDSGLDVLPPRPQPSDRIRLYARPRARGAPGFSADRYAATHGRVAMGLDATTGSIVWVHAHDADFLGGAAYEGGFALCDADGTITFLSADTGAVLGHTSLGKPADVCVVQADAFTPPAEAAAPAPARPLRDQIADALQLRYIDASPIQRFLLAELAASPDPRATETLIDLVVGKVVLEDLAPVAQAALASRSTGAQYLREALALRYDFLEGIESRPPVAPLADAAARAGDRESAPLLLRHLLDPVAPSAEVERAAAALAQLAGPAEVPALQQFFAMYRSEPSDASLVLAVAHVARALTRLGSSAPVRAAAADPYTSPAVRAKLTALAPDAATPSPDTAAPPPNATIPTP